MTDMVYRVKARLRLDLETAVLILVTVAALTTAASVALWTEAVVIPLAAFVLIEGSGVGALWGCEHQRVKRERREWARRDAAGLDYAVGVARMMLAMAENETETQVLPVVHSTVYAARSNPLEPSRELEMWSRLHDEDTGDIAVMN